jgi:dihydrofolate reductase
MISIIVAVSDDWGIGRNNELLWRIPDDMKRFKSLTMGKAVLMGKKTWESLPKRPLPGRTNIVVTDIPGESFEGAIMAYSIEDALIKCNKEEEIFIIGGGTIYRQFMLLADRLYITHVHKSGPADVYFPVIDKSIWKVLSNEDYPETETNPAYSYTVYGKQSNSLPISIFILCVPLFTKVTTGFLMLHLYFFIFPLNLLSFLPSICL